MPDQPMKRGPADRRPAAVVVALAAMMIAALPAAAQDPALPPVMVGVVLDGPAPPGGALGLLGTEDALGLIQNEIAILTRQEFDVRFPVDKQLDGGWSLQGIRGALDRLLADPEVDLVLALGVAASNDACRRSALPKPVVATFVLDPEMQQLPLEGDTSGIRNLSYVATSHSTVRDIRKFHELVGFGKVHLVHDALVLDLLPQIEGFTERALRDDGIDLVLIPAAGDPQTVLDALPSDVEAVYLTPLLRMSATDHDRLVAGINARGVPTFSFLGRTAVERGVLAGLEPRSDRSLLSRRVALSVQRILLGEDAGTLPIYLLRAERLTLNMATARAIDWFPRWRVLTEAELLHEEVAAIEERLSLEQAVRTAVEANVGLLGVQRFTEAGEEDIRRARSSYLPQIGVSTSGTQVDGDRGRAGLLGPEAERNWTGTASLTQLIYSDGVRANVQIQERLQESREFDEERIRLDVALSAATGFLEVLRAQALERIQKDNLRLTEANLESARRRRTIGVSGASEVYRWESQLARDRREVVAAQRTVDSARAVFNQVLNREQEMPFLPEEPDLEDARLLTGGDRLDPYVDNPKAFGVFREFQVASGLESAPELRALEAAIAAQERLLLTARRSFWAPDIFFFGDLTEFFAENGAGSESPPDTFAILGRNDTDWQVGVTASLPLYTGGRRRSEVRQARLTLEQLQLDRARIAQQVELRIRTALFEVASSYPAIEFNREAAEAARRNLDLVQDQYARGAADIIDLLDAQNAALSAEQLAANAEYDFLIDLMQMQRAVAHFDFFVSPEERDRWFDRLDRFYAERGVETGRGDR